MKALSGWFKRLREGKGKAGHRRWYEIRGRVLSSYKKKVKSAVFFVGHVRRTQGLCVACVS